MSNSNNKERGRLADILKGHTDEEIKLMAEKAAEITFKFHELTKENAVLLEEYMDKLLLSQK